MPKRSDDYMAARRRQIVEAALKCISTQGWLRTTIDDVAATAGLSKGAVYIHFANKRALLLGLLEASRELVEGRAAIADFATLRHEVLDGLEVLSGPEGPAIAIGHMEAQLDGVRDPEIRHLLDGSYRRVVEIFAGIVCKIRPDMAPAQARLHALTILLLLEGIRSYRTLNDQVSLADATAILDSQLDALNPSPD
jgi:AcrR family transcriptional regulator